MKLMYGFRIHSGHWQIHAIAKEVAAVLFAVWNLLFTLQHTFIIIFLQEVL